MHVSRDLLNGDLVPAFAGMTRDCDGENAHCGAPSDLGCARYTSGDDDLVEIEPGEQQLFDASVSPIGHERVSQVKVR
jgi:hypothetical protein